MDIRTQRIGHRGHGSEPENTMRALHKGHAVGSERIEFDIQKSQDGDYVVIHDSSVDRTTNGRGQVRQLSTAEIRNLDAGKGEKIPLFREVLGWAAENNVRLVIEVKDPEAGDEAELAQTVRSSGLQDPWLISSDGAFVERFEKLAPEVTTGIVVKARPLIDKSVLGGTAGLGLGLAGALGMGLGPLGWVACAAGGLLAGAATGYAAAMRHLRHKDLDRQVDYHIPSDRVISADLVDRAHQKGKKVACFTVDDPARGQQLVEWGVDGLISNYPERHLTNSKL